MKKKRFDCLQMKRTCQAEIRKQVRGMSDSEEIAFFRQAGKELQQRFEVGKKSRKGT